MLSFMKEIQKQFLLRENIKWKNQISSLSQASGYIVQGGSSPNCKDQSPENPSASHSFEERCRILSNVFLILSTVFFKISQPYFLSPLQTQNEKVKMLSFGQRHWGALHHDFMVARSGLRPQVRFFAIVINILLIYILIVITIDKAIVY